MKLFASHVSIFLSGEPSENGFCSNNGRGVILICDRNPTVPRTHALRFSNLEPDCHCWPASLSHRFCSQAVKQTFHSLVQCTKPRFRSQSLCWNVSAGKQPHPSISHREASLLGHVFFWAIVDVDFSRHGILQITIQVKTWLAPTPTKLLWKRCNHSGG